MDRRQVASHAALQKSAGRTRPRRDEAWGMTRKDQARSKLTRRNRRQNGPFTDGEVMRQVPTRRPRGGRLGNHSGDRPEKRPSSKAGGEHGPISQVLGVLPLRHGTTDRLKNP